MSNTKKKYGVRISVLEYGYYEVEARSKEEAEAKAEEKSRKGMSVGEILKLQIPQRKKSEKRKRRKILPVYTEKSSKAH